MALQKVNRNLLNTGVSDSSDATAITIDSSENVGIGTTTTDPYSLGATGKTLSINSSNADTGALLGLESADTKRGYLFGNQSNVVLSAVPSIPLVFKTADTTRMTILANGNVGIGGDSITSASSGRTVVEINGSSALKANAALVPAIRPWAAASSYPVVPFI